METTATTKKVKNRLFLTSLATYNSSKLAKLDKKLISRWENERELSFGYVLECRFTKLSERNVTVVQGHSRSPIWVPTRAVNWWLWYQLPIESSYMKIFTWMSMDG